MSWIQNANVTPIQLRKECIFISVMLIHAALKDK